MFLCNGGEGHSGEFVYIRDDREVSASVEYFSLCEVQIFGMDGKLPSSLWPLVNLSNVAWTDSAGQRCKGPLEFIEVSLLQSESRFISFTTTCFY